MSPNPEIRSDPVKDIQSAAAERVKQRQTFNRTPMSTPKPSANSVANATPAASGASNSNDGAQAGDRNQLIAERAYFLAQQRQFVGGDPVADWLQAEREIDRRSEDSPPVDSPR